MYHHMEPTMVVVGGGVNIVVPRTVLGLRVATFVVAFGLKSTEDQFRIFHLLKASLMCSSSLFSS